MAAHWAAAGSVRRQRGERIAQSFTGDFVERDGQGRISKLNKLRMESLNNFCRLWAIEVVPSCQYLALG